MTLPSQGEAPLSEAYQSIVKGILDEFVEGLPKVNSHLRVGLRYLHGNSFQDYLEKYMRPLIIKGVPSIMIDLREFYTEPTKISMIGDYLARAIQSMESERTLRDGDDDEQDPTVMLWLYYFMSQHNLF